MILADAISLGGGGGVIHALLMFLLVGLCVAAIWWVGSWFIAKMGLPAIAVTIWSGIFLIVGLIVLVNFLMGLGGHSFLAW